MVDILHLELAINITGNDKKDVIRELIGCSSGKLPVNQPKTLCWVNSCLNQIDWKL